MIVAMAQDQRVIVIKLADRLHNMRTIEYLGKQKQLAEGLLRDARGLRAARPPARHPHRSSGSSRISPSRRSTRASTARTKVMVNERCANREKYVGQAGQTLRVELDGVGIPAEISSRAKHFYSIYEKMAKGRSSTRSTT